ncbi:hypothetical protein [Pusillimonas sp. T2]|uniref:hypothetical protein n=1 Tax=Pusillimonas sp. T2 TaxID=1548123 RepID=UPI001C1FF62C|nr:hypothetical protein [Pusillimonas sp. T2]
MAQITTVINVCDRCGSHDDAAVDAFAATMKAKLAKKRVEGRGGWQECSAEYLSELLREHVDKGDPVDVANLAMMLHQNGQPIQPEGLSASLWSDIRELAAYAEGSKSPRMARASRAVFAWLRGAQPDEPVAEVQLHAHDASTTVLRPLVDFEPVDVGKKLYLAPQPQQIPEGSKLVPDFKVGMRVKFKGMECEIFAKGDRPGTFDICLPKGVSGDLWLNVPPDALEMLEAAPAQKERT